MIPAATSYTRTLAEFAAGLQAEQVPSELLREAGRILLDCLGCAVAGLTTPMGRIVAELARDEHGRWEATAIGAGRVSLIPAAFANVMLANALEFEVQVPEGHVCAVAAPVALAVAEALDAPGSELVVALVAGLEVSGRIGGALRGPARSTGAAGGHAHVVFAAAAAAGRLLHLTTDQMHHALGIAGYGATVRTTERYQGSRQALMIKNSLGVMAQAGIQAALLAQRGFTGDLEVLEGDLGFWRFTYAAGCDWEQLTRDLGRSWVAPEVWYKPAPSALNMVSTVQLLMRMVQEHGLRWDAIERVEIRAGRRADQPWPAGALNPTNFWRYQRYIFSLVLAGVRPWRSWLDPDTFRRPDVMALMDRLDLQPLREDDVPTAAGAYAEGWSPVRIEMQAGGRGYEGAQDYRVRLTDDQVRAKFRENVEGKLTVTDAGALEKLCGAPMALASGREIAMALRVEG